MEPTCKTPPREPGTALSRLHSLRPSAKPFTQLTRHFCSSLVFQGCSCSCPYKPPGFTTYCACSSPVSPEALMPVLKLFLFLFLYLYLEQIALGSYPFCQQSSLLRGDFFRWGVLSRNQLTCLRDYSGLCRQGFKTCRLSYSLLSSLFSFVVNQVFQANSLLCFVSSHSTNQTYVSTAARNIITTSILIPN